jgi:3-phosphoshikimate 1-carboxyvinyltransferase
VREPLATRDHTERLLRDFGVEVDCGPGRAAVCGPRIPDGVTVRVPGDISSAAFYLAAGVLAAEGEVAVRRVGVNPTRTGFLSVLRRMGAAIEIREVDGRGPEPAADLIARPSRLQGTRVEPEEIPGLVDEVPILAVLAAHARGVTEIRGAGSLRAKETDRIRAVAEGLRALGSDAEELPDGLVIRGRPGGLAGGCVRSCGDHRIAMSFAVAGLSAGGPVRVRGARWIATSDPGFLDGLSVLAPGCVSWRERA